MALYINGNKISGGGGNSNMKELTQEEYDELTTEEKNNGTVYYITDANGDGESFQPIIYSENEREIGVWIDGKPLYQKTFIFEESITGSGSTWLSTNINVNYINRLLNGIAYTSGVPYNVSVGKSSNNILEFMHFRNAEPTFIGLTIQYTKSTDQAGSGTWTPQGVPAVHYSTNEQVVGTWIDGKTLYQRVIVIDNPTVSVSNWVTFVNDDSIFVKTIKSKSYGKDSNDSIEIFDSNFYIDYNSYGRTDIYNNEHRVDILFKSNIFTLSKLEGIIQYTKSSQGGN